MCSCALRNLAVRLASALLAWVLFTSGAVAESLPPPPEGWEPLRFRRIERATRYEPVPDGDATALRAEARVSASALIHPLAAGERERTVEERSNTAVDQEQRLAEASTDSEKMRNEVEAREADGEARREESKTRCPEETPGGTFRLLVPSRVGTSTVVPRAASAKVMGNST